MASAQVLPNPGAASARKQGHLEAGKRRLEEFRKKKAEGRTKKAASTGQLPSVDVDVPETASRRSMSDRDTGVIPKPSGLVNFQTSEVGLLNGGSTSASNSYEQRSSDAVDEESNFHKTSGFSGLQNGYNDYWLDKNIEPRNQLPDLVSTKMQNAADPIETTPIIDGLVKELEVYPLVEAQARDFSSPEKYDKNSEQSDSLVSRTTPEITGNLLKQTTVEIASTSPNESTLDVNDGSMNQDNHDGFSIRGRRISDSINRHLNIENLSRHTSEYSSSDYNLTSESSSGQHSFHATIHGSGSTRSRPSFLDSINISRVPSSSPSPSIEIEKTDSHENLNKNSENEDVHLITSSQQPPAKPDIATTDVQYDNKEEQLRLSPEKDDNFAALEQHIEDLTQEKFSLQRALDTSRSLAESLASENSSLTDSFNHQGKVVNQLKSDMEQLQEEIRTRLEAFEALKMEYTNAQLECSAADERAKILASEVISLEEKALRLRSNELKLEKQLENSNAEISSFRRKLSSLEKEHRDFQFTIEALQEEKKLLQSKIRKASTYGKTIDNSNISIKRDASTSTMDLGVDEDMNVAETEPLRNASEEEGSSSPAMPDDASSSSWQHDSRTFPRPDISSTIPHDQIKMINNINSLVSELALEKEELMQALVAESSKNSELKDLNKELSQKLEVQTQSFELLAAQQMANENIHARPLDTQNIHDTTEYADEGDEVVERVLGWIMKLFPGGPAKRRTSKLL